MEENYVGLLSPWEEYYKKVYPMFDQDPEIELASEESDCIFYIKITVEILEKEAALKELLNNEIEM